MKKLIFPLLIFFISGCRGFNSIEKTNYSFDVKISPSEENIESELQLGYLNPAEKKDSLVFLLHKNLVIESLKGDKIESFRFDTSSTSPFPFTPEAGSLIIKLKNPLAKQERTDIKLKYSGKIGIVSLWKTNRIKEDWVELGLYSPWFPYDPGQKEIIYNMNLVLPEGYKAALNGSVESKNGVYKAGNSGADNDIVITASKNMKEWNVLENDISIKLFSAAVIADSTADNILSMGKNIFQNYIAWFGPNENLAASIVISPRETGGGYARKGFIVLSKISDKDFSRKAGRSGFVRYFAHEFAHLWFSSAPKDSWEDWLNESFAEYSALMMVRSLAGESEFINRINKKKEKIDQLPKIRGIDRNNEQAYDVLYDKGCYYLYELERELGKEEFLKIMKWTCSNHISSTDRLLEELGNRYGKTLAMDFGAKLDK